MITCKNKSYKIGDRSQNSSMSLWPNILMMIHSSCFQIGCTLHMLQNNTSRVPLFGCRTQPTKERLIGGDKPRIGLYNIEKKSQPHHQSVNSIATDGFIRLRFLRRGVRGDQCSPRICFERSRRRHNQSVRRRTSKSIFYTKVSVTKY